MYMSVIAEIILAFFAVFGLYALIRLFVTSRLTPREICIAVEIGRETEPQALALLLGIAADRAFFSGRRLLALVDRALEGDAYLIPLLRDRGIPIFFVDRKE